MSDEQKRCGLCKHWEPFEFHQKIGNCCAPIPKCVESDLAKYMGEIEGTDCPCFERKEASDA